MKVVVARNEASCGQARDAALGRHPCSGLVKFYVETSRIFLAQCVTASSTLPSPPWVVGQLVWVADGAAKLAMACTSLSMSVS